MDKKFAKDISRIPNKPLVYALEQNGVIIYVGSSIQPRVRLKQHLYSYLNGCMTNDLLQARWERWAEGGEAIGIRVLYEGDEEDVRRRELVYIEELDPECNIGRSIYTRREHGMTTIRLNNEFYDMIAKSARDINIQATSYLSWVLYKHFHQLEAEEKRKADEERAFYTE